MSDKAEEELSISQTSGSRGRKRKFEDRFDGISESELKKRTLPDHLDDNLDIVIIGINPGYTAALKGHHYAGLSHCLTRNSTQLSVLRSGKSLLEMSLFV